MTVWPVQHATARFSELLDACQREGHQREGHQVVSRAAFCALLMHRQSETPWEDATIATVHNLAVLTSNIADFGRFEVGLLNPFLPG